MQQALIGFLTSFLIEKAKYVEAIPLTSKNVKLIRTIAVVLSIGGTFLLSWMDGTLAQSGVMSTISEGLVSWIFSVASYNGLIRKTDQS